MRLSLPVASVSTALVVTATFLALLVPVPAEARLLDGASIRDMVHERICTQLGTHFARRGIALPSFCETPPPVDVCPLVDGVQESGPCASDQCIDPATWSVEDQQCVDPVVPTLDHIVMSEVYYDPDAAHGTEGNNDANEWVELYNPTDSEVDISGWRLVDGSTSDVLPATTTIAARGYLLIVATSSTEGFWDVPTTTPVVNLGSAIGNGLGNASDELFLQMADQTDVDAVSWGTNVSAFDPAAPDIADGHSLARTDEDTDTDTAADWVDREVPTPGE